MDWLGDWLKQVILIILLAAFVDLLLPNQAMQRYVKTVVSLFLLLTILTPVFEFFQRGWDAEKLIAEAEQMQLKSKLVAAIGGSGREGRQQSLESILAQSEKVKKDNQSEARKLAEAALAEKMKAGLEKKTGSKVEALEAFIDIDSKGNPVIRSVRVTLLHNKSHPLETAEAGRGSRQGKVQVKMEEVKPVTIAIDSSVSGKAGTTLETGASAESSLAGDQQTDAVRFFQEEWQVPSERLEIKIVS